jgi:CO/xanthine dehydrogenase FAD-binding subunit
MAKVIGYHRPESIEEALAILSAPGAAKVLLAGGTAVNADPGFDPIEVIDLQALGIDQIAEGDGRLRLGATTTLQDLADDPRVPGVMAAFARSELPSTLRTLGTIGGLVATGDPESELLAALLTHRAIVTIVDEDGASDRDLAEVLASGPAGIITAVSVETGGATASAHTGRTPGDRPIVAAVARRADDGSTHLALCGVAATPVLVEDPATVDPPGDFRGSSAYRKHLASILSRRVLGEVG